MDPGPSLQAVQVGTDLGKQLVAADLGVGCGRYSMNLFFILACREEKNVILKKKSAA